MTMENRVSCWPQGQIPSDPSLYPTDPSLYSWDARKFTDKVCKANRSESVCICTLIKHRKSDKCVQIHTQCGWKENNCGKVADDLSLIDSLKEGIERKSEDLVGQSMSTRDHSNWLLDQSHVIWAVTEIPNLKYAFNRHLKEEQS